MWLLYYSVEVLASAICLFRVSSSASMAGVGFSSETLFGPTTQTQFGMGYGALLVASGFLFLFTQGLAARGAIKGDVFVSGSIGLTITMVTAFVFFPVGRILINALQDDEGNYVFSLFLEKITSHNIWGLACLSSELSCGVAWNSLWMGVLVGTATTVLGLAFALLVTRTGIQAKGFVRTVSLLPIITPPFVIGLALILLLGRAGAVNAFLEVGFWYSPQPLALRADGYSNCTDFGLHSDCLSRPRRSCGRSQSVYGRSSPNPAGFALANLLDSFFSADATRNR